MEGARQRARSVGGGGGDGRGEEARAREGEVHASPYGEEADGALLQQRSFCGGSERAGERGREGGREGDREGSRDSDPHYADLRRTPHPAR